MEPDRKLTMTRQKIFALVRSMVTAVQEVSRNLTQLDEMCREQSEKYPKVSHFSLRLAEFEKAVRVFATQFEIDETSATMRNFGSAQLEIDSFIAAAGDAAEDLCGVDAIRLKSALSEVDATMTMKRYEFVAQSVEIVKALPAVGEVRLLDETAPFLGALAVVVFGSRWLRTALDRLSVAVALKLILGETANCGLVYRTQIREEYDTVVEDANEVVEFYRAILRKARGANVVPTLVTSFEADLAIFTQFLAGTGDATKDSLVGLSGDSIGILRLMTKLDNYATDLARAVYLNHTVRMPNEGEWTSQKDTASTLLAILQSCCCCCQD